MSLAQLHWEAGAFGRAQEVLQQSAEFCSDHPTWRLNLAHALVAQEDGFRLGEAAELYQSLVTHFAGPPGVAGGSGGDALGGSLLDVPPAALANLCVCHVVGSQNEVAEELLRRLEDVVGAAGGSTGGSEGAPGGVPPHLSLTNLAIGTLYCAKGALGLSASSWGCWTANGRSQESEACTMPPHLPCVPRTGFCAV